MKATLKQQYIEALKKHEDTLALILRNSRNPQHSALDTPEKRACFRVGWENGFSFRTGVFSHPDTKKERFHGIRMLHPHQATSNDAFYATLGSSLSHVWK